MDFFPQHEDSLLFLVNNITNYVIGYSKTILISPMTDNKNVVPRNGWILNIDSGNEKHSVEDPRVVVYPDDDDDQPQPHLGSSSTSASTICLIVLVVCLMIASSVFYLLQKNPQILQNPAESYQMLKSEIVKKLPW